MATPLAGAKMIALQKNMNDVRPIAVGDCFRRPTAKIACHELKQKISSFFSPSQYEVAMPGGAQLMVPLIQACLENNRD